MVSTLKEISLLKGTLMESWTKDKRPFCRTLRRVVAFRFWTLIDKSSIYTIVTNIPLIAYHILFPLYQPKSMYIGQGLPKNVAYYIVTLRCPYHLVKHLIVNLTTRLGWFLEAHEPLGKIEVVFPRVQERQRELDHRSREKTRESLGPRRQDNPYSSVQGKQRERSYAHPSIDSLGDSTYSPFKLPKDGGSFYILLTFFFKIYSPRILEFGLVLNLFSKTVLKP